VNAVKRKKLVVDIRGHVDAVLLQYIWMVWLWLRSAWAFVLLCAAPDRRPRDSVTLEGPAIKFVSLGTAGAARVVWQRRRHKQGDKECSGGPGLIGGWLGKSSYQGALAKIMGSLIC
jgi:hypothetical protein